MSGLSPKFPLIYDGIDGYYTLNKTFKDVVSQNLKNLILTSPGERIMDLDFGVGIYNILFEQSTPEVESQLISRIGEQVAKYMPFIELVNVQIYPNESDRQDYFGEIANYINVVVSYFVPSLDVEETLEINITNI